MTTTMVSLDVDVSDAAGLDAPAHTRVTVTLPAPDALADPPVVAFAWPGGGYNRRYYTFDMPGESRGGQAGWHADRGWVFVACDHLGVGDSSRPDPDRLLWENMAAVNAATANSVLRQLAEGSLDPDFPKLEQPLKIGLGQSRGGSLVIVTQAHHRPFDGIGVLGYSAIHTSPKPRPGWPRQPQPWIARSSLPHNPVILNAAQVAQDTAAVDKAGPGPDVNPHVWCFHYDDVDRDLVRHDMEDFPFRHGNLPEWGDNFVPAMSRAMLTPGVVASEAASIDVPVLAAFGERDVAADPWQEPQAYRQARDVTVFVCPRMGHMHNFASTRVEFWKRIGTWSKGLVRE